MTTTPDRNLLETEVIRLWNGEHSAGIIARRMKTTRNVVIGIVNRARPRGLITRALNTPSAVTQRQPTEAVETKRRAKTSVPSVPKKPKKKQEEPETVVSLFSPPSIAAEPKILVETPPFTCRVVVGKNDRGQDLYCCEPTYRQKDGKIGRISVCEAHKPRMLSKAALSAGADQVNANAIDRLSTTFQRERRGGKKSSAFGKTLKGQEQ